jgi:crotonobetainyl-CoA:carnitine CoA-transferase CaiB-like acyl-CoA transferase
MANVLEGIRVVDFTERVQGPSATQILGDLGADVIKIERTSAVTPDGRPDERYGVSAEDATLYRATFLANNRNKRSLAIDLKTTEGREIVTEIISTADVVYENFRPGVMDRLGVGYDRLVEVNPDIIYVDATGYGRDGPYQDLPGQDLLIQAISGMGQMNVAASGRPQPVGMSITDILGGLYGAIGVLAALLHRGRGGSGQRVSIDLLSGAVAALSEHLVHRANSNVGEPERATEMHGHGYIPPPYGFYRTRDGFIALSSGRNIGALCDILGIPNLEDDPRFESFERRLTNRVAMEALLEDALGLKTTQEWLAEMVPADIFAQRVNTLGEAIDDIHVLQRGLVTTVTHPQGTVRLLAPPIRLAETPMTIRLAPPAHGEHPREILSSLRSNSQWIDALYERGIVA